MSRDRFHQSIAQPLQTPRRADGELRTALGLNLQGDGDELAEVQAASTVPAAAGRPVQSTRGTVAGYQLELEVEKNTRLSRELARSQDEVLQAKRQLMQMQQLNDEQQLVMEDLRVGAAMM